MERLRAPLWGIALGLMLIAGAIVYTADGQRYELAGSGREAFIRFGAALFVDHRSGAMCRWMFDEQRWDLEFQMSYADQEVKSLFSNIPDCR